MTRLVKSSYDKMLFGVCGGLAQRFGMDSTVVRAIFVHRRHPRGGIILHNLRRAGIL